MPDEPDFATLYGASPLTPRIIEYAADLYGDAALDWEWIDARPARSRDGDFGYLTDLLFEDSDVLMLARGDPTHDPDRQGPRSRCTFVSCSSSTQAPMR